MKKVNPPFSLEELKELIDYDPVAGLFTHSLKRGGLKAGKPMPASGPMGYIRFNIQGHYVYAHRLAWFYVHGKWPDNEIDHINRNKKDNRIANLRDVTRSVNQLNRLTWGAIDLKGVRLSKTGNRFVAQINLRGKFIHLGSFKDANHAHGAYRIAASTLQ